MKKGPRTGKPCPPPSTAAGARRAHDGCRHPPAASSDHRTGPREDALLEERLHQLFGPPATIHQGGDVDWSYEQYQEALAQLEAEGVIRPTSEVVG